MDNNNEIRTSQLRYFFKEHKQVDGLYFDIHFSDFKCKKITLELMDFYTKTPLEEPIFSPDCVNKTKIDEKSPRICLFNIETLNNFLGSQDFDGNSTVICPLCKNISRVTNFYYEKSIVSILDSIKNFCQDNDNKTDALYKISVQANFQWKTKNYVYFKGNLKKQNSEQKNSKKWIFHDFDFDLMEKYETFNKENEKFFDSFFEENQKELVYEEEEKQIISNNEKCFPINCCFIEKNTNSMLVLKHGENDSSKISKYRLLYNPQNPTPLIFYENFEFFIESENTMFIFTDSGTLLKSIIIDIKPSYFRLGSLLDRNVYFIKYHCFEQRFFSPKLHCFNEFIYIFGGNSMTNEVLISCYKIPIMIKKLNKQIEHIGDMPNKRKNSLSFINEKMRKIFFLGGKIEENNKKFEKNIDVYNIEINSWSIIQTSTNLEDLNIANYFILPQFNFSDNNHNILIFRKNYEFYKKFSYFEDDLIEKTIDNQEEIKVKNILDGLMDLLQMTKKDGSFSIKNLSQFYKTFIVFLDIDL